tara:strand:- start:680 stop:886 length:207 start_codon:yes stop_codon:yes gene_type:complete
MLLSSVAETPPFFIKEPFNLDKWLFAAISGGALGPVMVFVSDADYHTKHSMFRHHILVLAVARCGQSY